jgi:hypothetical protein
MFCIQLIWKNGGSNSIRAETKEECRAIACKRKVSREHVVATVPYEVFKSPRYQNVYDVSIPEDIRQGLGEEVMKMYSQGE